MKQFLGFVGIMSLATLGGLACVYAIDFALQHNWSPLAGAALVFGVLWVLGVILGIIAALSDSS